MRANETAVQQLQETLNEAYPNGEWLNVLRVFAPVGLADNIQIRTASGLERSKLSRLLDKFDALTPGLPPVYQLYDHTIPRACGYRGRNPNIFFLGETGAALLRANAFPDAHVSDLQSDHAIAHALSMLDVHLSALRYGLDIVTDQVIPYAGNKAIRPDHQVRLPDGNLVLVEVEQTARKELVRRIHNSLQNKQDFFSDPASEGISGDVRMVLNIKPGQAFQRTIALWREVIHTVAQASERPLAFRLYAISLIEFLQNPEWESTQALGARWIEIHRPHSVPVSPVEKDQTLQIDTRVTENLREDLVLLQALYQSYQEDEHTQSQRQIDWDLPDVMLFIYKASHPDDRRSVLWLLPPYDSVYLLKEFLNMHPGLKQRLRTSLHYNTSKWSWSGRTILHRMQHTINTFLGYFGWRNSYSFSARAVYGEADSFDVQIASSPNFFGGLQESTQTKESFAWVLRQLFERAGELGLGRPKFW